MAFKQKIFVKYVLSKHSFKKMYYVPLVYKVWCKV